MQFMICCGASLAYVLGTFITWRTLAIIGKKIILGSSFYRFPKKKMGIDYMYALTRIRYCISFS
jgi:hypothetical protein